ncbi:hypothetical protein ACFFU8_13055 [Chromobacterium piscinae]|uniref:hypothetical protein n=1 Tax=Chromobacterium piscinae TaxID=686831 RepID=UPI001E576F51|nr:hypothetical protein [Chromobacterium piscinae]MCD4506479.1 hypothetical protein [Chromobacterium piscinae]MCD5328474.1 hypothetical protein [Chromobacterium piscinae]
MKIQDLKEGDLVTQSIDGKMVLFQVACIQKVGSRYIATFSSNKETTTTPPQTKQPLETGGSNKKFPPLSLVKDPRNVIKIHTPITP